MSGGTFTAMNKVRPGAYINFKAVPQSNTQTGTRGIVTIPLGLSWGAEDAVIEILSTDLADGKSFEKTGVKVADTTAEAQVMREALKNCSKALIYRVDTGAVNATATLGTLIATAKYKGSVGNLIQVAILEIETGVTYDVVTIVDGKEIERQRAQNAENLVNNEWVTFTGTGLLVETAGTVLEGGIDGTVSDTNYSTYFDTIKTYFWNTMAIPSTSTSLPSSVVTLVKDMRENKGIKVQAVLHAFNTADYEGIISVDQGYKTENESVSAVNFTAYIAGLTAGSNVNKSNTYHEIPGALDIINPLVDEDIEAGLTEGRLMLSRRIDGKIVIEKDINTLVTFTPEKSYDFSKNRVIRTLDEIAMFTLKEFTTNYIGKVNNDDAGRNILKGTLVGYFNNLQKIGAIQNFNSAEDIVVSAGESIDTVIVDVTVQPVDAMEKLYMTVNVGGNE